MPARLSRPPPSPSVISLRGAALTHSRISARSISQFTASAPNPPESKKREVSLPPALHCVSLFRIYIPFSMATAPKAPLSCTSPTSPSLGRPMGFCSRASNSSGLKRLSPSVGSITVKETFLEMDWLGFVSTTLYFIATILVVKLKPLALLFCYSPSKR